MKSRSFNPISILQPIPSNMDTVEISKGETGRLFANCENMIQGVNLTARSNDPRKYNPWYQHESSRKLVSEKYIKPIGAKRTLAEIGMATVLVEYPLGGRPVALERL
jgi:hypothetical protein